MRRLIFSRYATKRDLKVSAILAILALFVGVLSAYATDRWIEGAERGAADLSVAKKELLASAGLAALHHTVYAKVGEERWERQVKPDFLSAITRATVWETGDPMPTWRRIVDWVRAHPEEARRMLESAAASP